MECGKSSQEHNGGRAQRVAGQGFFSCSPSQSLSRDRAAGEWPRESPAQESGTFLGQVEGWTGCLGELKCGPGP